MLLNGGNMNDNSVEEVFTSESICPGSEPEIVENDEETKITEKLERLCHLPIARVKHIVKLDPEINLTSHEAVFVIAKATEMFIENLAKESHFYTQQAKKKTMIKRDIDLAIENIDALVFLEGMLE